MIDQILDSLREVKEFKGLEKGCKVYSKQYGVGELRSVYKDDEIIVQFSNLSKRVSVLDGISKIPERYLKKQKNTKIEVACDGKNMSFAEFKRKNRDAKKREELEQQIQKEEERRVKKLKRDK